MFSATFNDTVKNLITKIVGKENNELFVKKEDLSFAAVKQYKVRVPDELSKIEVINNYILEIGEKVGQTMIFVHTINSAKMLHKALFDRGYKVSSIIDVLEYNERDKIIEEFKDGLTQILISSDVLARGFDNQQVLIFSSSLSPLYMCLDSFFILIHASFYWIV
jgi:ATP-dependent RNA helicase DDX19/DBP5